MREAVFARAGFESQLHPPPKMLSTGIMYVRSEDLDANGLLKDGVPIEPLILRANAGDCIVVNLTNAITANSDLLKQNFKWSPPFDMVPAGGSTAPAQSHASGYVGLHPQLLAYDAATSSGVNVGWNVTWDNQTHLPIKNNQVVDGFSGANPSSVARDHRKHMQPGKTILLSTSAL